ncbi:MAG: hypothetical protein WD063_05245 [Pirellulales bacterium]
MLTPISENRWEFPKIGLDGPGACGAAILEKAAKSAGLRGAVAADEPLGSYVTSRGNETRSMTGFLMCVEHVEDPWPRKDSYRRLWCLAEEARVRIRRKPLRRFIDLALHSVNDHAAAPAGGHRQNGAR